MDVLKHSIANAYRDIQSQICLNIEDVDGQQKFIKDKWHRDDGGGGLSRILQHGAILEKAGVNFSEVFGVMNDQMRQNLHTESTEFYATGVSIVMHPKNPHVPIIHMNIRYFEMNNGDYWFGGGMDLTPHYVDTEDAAFFHSELKAVCDIYHTECYPTFKKWADNYFFIPHRNETRGIGGIFYDQLKAGDYNLNKLQILDFSLDLGHLFSKIYTALIRKHCDQAFTESEKNWQLLRRGRYVEFNLVHDRGTRFGLESNGRTESILMSLPAEARWEYNSKPKKSSKEGQTLSWLKKDIDWAY